jgi:light-regulated signal transduction histidine kinase (bacteriophytochrome)
VKPETQLGRPAAAKNIGSNDFEEFGRAAIQIVHDLKNQLNGLKLYATFLRKRLDREDRPVDERETIAKLMAGIDRAASDLTAIVRYAQPREFKYQDDVDLLKLVMKALDEPNIDPSFKSNLTESISALRLYGKFDSSALSDAIRIFAEQASVVNQAGPLLILKIDRKPGSSAALIEWRSSNSTTQDLFCSADGIAKIRMALATRIISRHHGQVEHDASGLRIQLPVKK